MGIFHRIGENLADDQGDRLNMPGQHQAIGAVMVDIDRLLLGRKSGDQIGADLAQMRAQRRCAFAGYVASMRWSWPMVAMRAAMPSNIRRISALL